MTNQLVQSIEHMYTHRHIHTVTQFELTLQLVQLELSAQSGG